MSSVPGQSDHVSQNPCGKKPDNPTGSKAEYP